MPTIAAVIYYLRLGRPLFLAGGVALYLLGVTVALYQGASIDLSALVWGQLAVTAVQVMTHYSNDYFDLRADQANLTPTRWSGGSGILPAGLVSPKIALATALFAAALALGVAVWLLITRPVAPLAPFLILLSVFLAWSYSAPPLQLHSTGSGEVVAALVVGALTPLVGYYLQAADFSLMPFLAATPIALLQGIMLLLIEFPDAAGDAAVGKRTLVVRLGPPRAARLLQALIVAYLLVLLLLALAGLPPLVLLLILSFNAPALLWLLWRLRQGAWARPSWWNWLGFVGVALIVGTALLQLVGFLALSATAAP